MAGGRRRGLVTKSIFDPVHGPITLDGLALRLVATASFQRLWGIRQTGFAHLVFPGANHTRLEHSLGTFWVARQMAERFGLDGEETERVGVAALLHDLGHPPFSHTLDGPLREVLGVSHETVSRARIEGDTKLIAGEDGELARLLEGAGISPRGVADLVDPRPSRRRSRLPFSILHGAIDADRIDYLERDAHYTGVAHGSIDAVRLFDTLRHVGRRPYFAEKGRSAVEGFLVERALMYASVYYHKTVRAAEMMAQAAVERSAGYPSSARGLFTLTDGDLLVRLRDAGASSAALVEGLLSRRLYKRVLGLKELSASARRRWRVLAETPEARRQVEDELAGRLRTDPGTVLVDVAGVERREGPADDWGEVGVGERGRISYPFRPQGPWRTLALRPPSEWAVTVYVAAQHRRRATEKLTARAVARALG